MYGRSLLGKNTRLLYDLMQITQYEEIPGLVLLLDFEKAFDSVSWTVLSIVLVYFLDIIN